MGRLWRAGALTSAWALCVTLLTASPAMAAGPVRLGSAPAVPDGARIVSAVPATTQLHVTVTLQSQDPAGLAAFATEVSTPGSALYRDYITPAEFAQRFGATPQAVQAVDSSLESHGLVPGAVSANSLSIPVTASAGSLSAAFATSFSRVALADGTSAIVNSQSPSLDSTIAPDVQGVLGLSTVSQEKPLLVQAHDATALAPADRAHVATGGPQPCAAATDAAQAGGFTADQIAAAYGLSGLYEFGGANGTPDEGAGQTVAILELESYDPNDIAAFEQCYEVNGQPVNPLIANIPIDGGGGTGPGQGEAALDIENVISLAPQARIAVYTGPNTGSGPYDTMAAIISQHLAQVVSTSWGQCEHLEGSAIGLLGEHPVPGGGGAGDVDRLGVGRRRVRGLLPDAADAPGRRPGEPAVRDRGGRDEPDHERDDRRPRERDRLERRNDGPAPAAAASRASGRCRATSRARRGSCT